MTTDVMVFTLNVNSSSSSRVYFTRSRQMSLQTDNITNEQSMHRYKDYCKQQLVGCSLDELAKYLTVGRRNEIPLERNSKKKNLGCCRKHLGPM